MVGQEVKAGADPRPKPKTAAEGGNTCGGGRKPGTGVANNLRPAGGGHQSEPTNPPKGGATL